MISPVPSGELSSTTSMSQSGSAANTSSTSDAMLSASLYVAVKTRTLRNIAKTGSDNSQ